MDGSWTLGRYW